MKFLALAVIAGSTTDAVQFDCTFSFHTPAFFRTVYTCFPAITFTGSAILGNVTGDHESGYTNDDVEYLFVADRNLPFALQGIENFFENLKGLQYSDTGILSISAADLEPFPQLEYFVLFQNNLTSLDGDLFSNTPLLRYLFLNSNQIQHIGHDLVTNLDDLLFMFLGGNICIDRIAAGRAEVMELAPQLSVLCPPLDATTPEQCPCDEEIEELREENQLQYRQIQELNSNIDQLMLANEKLFELNAAVEQRLLEVELRLQEISPPAHFV